MFPGGIYIFAKFMEKIVKKEIKLTRKKKI